MEESQQIHSDNPSYWTSIAIAALVLGFIYFVITLVGGYATINSEPSGSMFGNLSQSITWLGACLISGFAGMLAIWHYSNTYGGVTVTLGKGALIGLYSGLAIAVIVTILNQIWNLIDPAYTEKLMDSMIANFEAMEGMSDTQRQQMIDSMASEFENSETLWGIIKGTFFVAIPLCILNLITGMIGAKIFGKNEEVV